MYKGGSRQPDVDEKKEKVREILRWSSIEYPAALCVYNHSSRLGVRPVSIRNHETRVDKPK